MDSSEDVVSKFSTMANNALPKIITLASALLLSACVTQNYENNTPIIENQANNNEMAATRISLGLGYLKMGNMTQAKLNLEKAKRFAPNLVQVYTAFAHYYETVGEDELTVQSYEKALSLAADDADTLNNYGVFLCRKGKTAEAEVQLLKAIAVPTYLLVAQSYENLSSCYLNIDDFTKAEQYLGKAVDHSPNRTATLLQMVRLQYAMGNYQQAKIFQQKFERHTRRFTPDSLALAYKVYLKLGQKKIAENYANMLVRMYPQSWESKQYLLNELAQIEADMLAQRYALTQRKTQSLSASTQTKKRVVKLSPSKHNQRLSTKAVVGGDKMPISANASSSTIATSALETEVNSNGSRESLNEGVTKGELTVVAALSADSNTAQSTERENTLSESTVNKSTASENIVNDNTVTDNSVKEKNDTLTADNEKETEKVGIASQKSTIETEETQLAEQQVTSVEASIKPQSSTFTTPVPAKRDAPLPEVTEYIANTDSQSNPPSVVKDKTLDEVSAEVTSLETKSLAEHDSVAQEKSTEVSDIVEKKIATSESKSKSPKTHTVQKSESLYAISVKYNIKISALKRWNNMSSKQKLFVGKKLYIENPNTVDNNE